MERFTTSDGVELAYKGWGTPGDRPTVFLHHGFIADAHMNWKGTGVVAALLADGRHVVAHDARGHGRSDKPHDPALYGESRMARDLSELVTHLGHDVYDLAGYSMGGITALIAATQDDRIRRLVVGGIGAGVVEQGGVDRRVLDRSKLADILEADDPGTIDDPAAAAFRAFADATGGDRLALAAQARSVHTDPIPLDRITAPTLVLVGDDDPLGVRPQVLADAIPDATVTVVPGDHLGALVDPGFAPALVAHLRG